VRPAGDVGAWGSAPVLMARRSRSRSFPDTPAADLNLLPAPARNPDGRRPISRITEQHRNSVGALPDMTVPVTVDADGQSVREMLPFDKAKIYPYAYRHTYAQRHADAGVEADVLRQLMDHRHLSTTQQYYRSGTRASVRRSRRSPRCSSTGTATGSGAASPKFSTPSICGAASARSPFPTACASSPATSPRAAPLARSGSAAWAALPH